MNRIWVDLRYAIRTLLKSPGFACVAILTLAIGIGATVTIFSITNSVLLQPLPYRDADRLLSLSSTNRERGLTGMRVSYTKYSRMRAQARTLDGIGGFFPLSSSLKTDGAPEAVDSAMTTPSLFELLNAVPVIGRNFSVQEDSPG